MRLLTLLFVSLALTSVVAQDSFCTKYAKAVFKKTNTTGADEFNLLQAVVARVIIGCDDNIATRYGVPGAPAGSPFAASGCTSALNTAVPQVKGLVADPLNALFFNGAAPNYNSQTGLQQLNTAAGIAMNNSIRFVNVSGFNVLPNPAAAGTATAEGLVAHLIEFFGAALGCPSTVNNNNPTPANGSYIGKYAGVPSMGLVHKNMNITKPVWNEFVNTFATALLSFGVSAADLNTTVVPYVSTFLLQPGGATTTNNVICNDPNTCDCVAPFINVKGACVTPTPAPTTPPKGTATMITMSPIVAFVTIALLALL